MVRRNKKEIRNDEGEIKETRHNKRMTPKKDCWHTDNHYPGIIASRSKILTKEEREEIKRKIKESKVDREDCWGDTETCWYCGADIDTAVVLHPMKFRRRIKMHDGVWKNVYLPAVKCERCASLR